MEKTISFLIFFGLRFFGREGSLPNRGPVVKSLHTIFWEMQIFRAVYFYTCHPLRYTLVPLFIPIVIHDRLCANLSLRKTWLRSFCQLQPTINKIMIGSTSPWVAYKLRNSLSFQWSDVCSMFVFRFFIGLQILFLWLEKNRWFVSSW